MKLDLHCHSKYSVDGRLSIEELLAIAKRIGLDGLAVTDHNEIGGSIKAHKIASEFGLVVIRGIEISSHDGHILAYGISEAVPRNLSASETLERIEKLGGIGVAAHPYRWITGLKKKTILSNRFAALEACNANSLDKTNRKVERLAAEINVGITGGSDSHTSEELGAAFTIFKERSEAEDDLIEEIVKRRTEVQGNGRSIAASIKYAVENIRDWFSRGMKRI